MGKEGGGSEIVFVPFRVKTFEIPFFRFLLVNSWIRTLRIHVPVDMTTRAVPKKRRATV